MSSISIIRVIRGFLLPIGDYGILLIVVGFCLFFSLATITEQHPAGEAGGAQLAGEIRSQTQLGTTVLIVTRGTAEDEAFGRALAEGLTDKGWVVVGRVSGEPADLRQALLKLQEAKTKLDAVAATAATATWPILDNVAERFPELGHPLVFKPTSYAWPNFLKTANLLNIVNQIVVIALIAIGMTAVIISGGIDLSVGSLMALSAVTSTLLIREVFGAREASAQDMVLACLVAIGLCGLVGLASGCLISLFEIPPFIVTLGMMLVASGTAFKLANDESVYEVPDSFIWLGRGADLGPIPNAVVLLIAMYLIAHVVMTHTTMGRYIYGVGGNAAASRYAGISVRRVHIQVYAISGLFAGLGGVVLASQLKSGSPKYGQMYEMYVIAAVVVGGTSLSGGKGTIFGTLLGALLIAVIQNGMNLTGVESNTQRILLGALILIAVLLDISKRRIGQRLRAGKVAR
jgi:ribose transport system permease protein